VLVALYKDQKSYLLCYDVSILLLVG